MRHESRLARRIIKTNRLMIQKEAIKPMRPRIYKALGLWHCYAIGDNSILGTGLTPKEAYLRWKAYQ